VALLRGEFRLRGCPAIPPEQSIHPILEEMNTTVLTPSGASIDASAVQKKLFRVTVVTDPVVLGQSPAKYVNIVLGPNMSPNASAVLSNFSFVGGAVTKHSMNHGAKGDFTSSITMRCWPETACPQVIGLLGTTLKQFSFIVALETKCSVNDCFAISLCDLGGTWFPTTAVGSPGLIGNVSWNTAGQFTPAGYAGNGQIDGQSDTGFSATVLPF
jgi:hypothetical protein